MPRTRPWSCRRDGHYWQLALLPDHPAVCHYCGTPETPEPTRATPTAPPVLAGAVA